MATIDFQLRNSQNLQALIDYVRQTSSPNTIDYFQAGKMVLLGKGHNPADVKRINDVVGDWKFNGKLSVNVVQTGQGKKSQNKLAVQVTPGPQSRKGSMRELEDAVQAAAKGTSARDWPMEIKWS